MIVRVLLVIMVSRGWQAGTVVGDLTLVPFQSLQVLKKGPFIERLFLKNIVY